MFIIIKNATVELLAFTLIILANGAIEIPVNGSTISSIVVAIVGFFLVRFFNSVDKRLEEFVKDSIAIKMSITRNDEKIIFIQKDIEEIRDILKHNKLND